MIRSLPAVAGAMALVLACGALPGVAQGREAAKPFEELAPEVEALSRAVEQIEAGYLQGDETLRQVSMANTYLDARYLFGVGSTAAVIELLLPLVEDEANHGAPGFSDVLSLLAESLFVQRDYLMARRYYVWLESDPRYGLDAVGRQIEIALSMGRYESLEALFVRLEQLGGARVGDQIAYVRGKALYFQRRWADAAEAFGRVPANSELLGRARYFGAVTLSRMGQLGEAQRLLDRILSASPHPQEAQDPLFEQTQNDLRDLARLAKGRLYYEVEDWAAALDQYALVERTSARYPAALYEIAWSQIRLGSNSIDEEERQEYLGAALGTLAFLELVAEQESRFRAQALLLRGDVLTRMGQHEEALAQFETAAAAYFPVEEELRQIRERHEDPDLFYDAVVNPETGSLRLPLAARPWFESDPQLDRTLRAIADVATLRNEIAETRQLVEELDAVLNGGGLINAFPRLREGWGLMTETQVRATRTLIDLVDAEAALVAPHLDAGSLEQLRRLNVQRHGLQEAILDQPRTFSEIGSREQAVIDRLNELVLEVHRSEMRVQSSRDDLEALRELVMRRAQFTPPDLLRELRDQMEVEFQQLEEQSRRAAAMRRELMRRQVAVGVADEVLRAERESRQRFIVALGQEHQLLAETGGRFAELQPLLQQGAALMTQVMDADRQCEAFFVSARDIVAEQTAGLRDLLERERANVERYEEELVETESFARGTAGDVAIEAFEDVWRRFSELTMRANLGALDIAWERKEEVTLAIERLLREREASIEALDQAWEEAQEVEP